MRLPTSSNVIKGEKSGELGDKLFTIDKEGGACSHLVETTDKSLGYLQRLHRRKSVAGLSYDSYLSIYPELVNNIVFLPSPRAIKYGNCNPRSLPRYVEAIRTLGGLVVVEHANYYSFHKPIKTTKTKTKTK